ncbi:MAG: tetratricopeptide repeat protein [Novosphingobium sp.]|uniref:tetratricopeptide repeat protein n=1 Tax=Novosphingobium sp. TaxID=1874826 RepID=UPI0032BC51D9
MKRALPLLLLLALPGCGQDDPATLLKQAMDEYAQQDYAAARIDALAVLQARPGDRQAALLLAQSLLRLGDGEGAQAAIEQLKALGWAGPALGRLEAEAMLARGLPKQAIERLADDRSADAWRIIAAARLKLDDSAGALDAYKAGLAAGGGYLLSLDFANFLLAGDDLAGAAAQLRALQGYDANALATLMLAATIHNKHGRKAEAHKGYAEAAKRYPLRVEPLVADARLYDEEGKVDTAIELVDQAAKLAPDHPEVFELKVMLASIKGDWEKVRSLLGPIETSLVPLSANYMTYAEALLRLGHPEQARAMFERALQVSPHNPYSRLMAGEAQLATGDARAAWATLQPLAISIMAGPRELELGEKAARAAGDQTADALAARLRSPGFKQAQNLTQQGQQALARRDWPAAIAAYQALLALGQDAEAHKRLAFALTNSAQHDQAIAEADRALALEPENADMLHMAGLTRFNAGRDAAKALQLLQAAARKDPASALFRTDLARAQQASRS